MSDNLSVNQLPKHLLVGEPHDETLEVTITLSGNLDLEDGFNFLLETGDNLLLEGNVIRDAFILGADQLPKLLFADDLDD